MVAYRADGIAVMVATRDVTAICYGGIVNGHCRQDSSQLVRHLILYGHLPPF